MTKQVEITWPMIKWPLETYDVSGDSGYLFHFKTPRAPALNTQPPAPQGTLGPGKGMISLVEFNGPPWPRVGGLYLDQECSQLVPGTAYGGGTANNIAPSLVFYGSPQVGGHGKPKDVVVLQPNTDYYWLVSPDPASGSAPALGSRCTFEPCMPQSH